MFAAPPCISTSSGYFFVSSKAGGSTSMLWIFFPRLDVNQKCTGGSQSTGAAASTSNDVRLANVFAAGSMRTTSAGLIDEPQRASRIVDDALAGMTKSVTTPRCGSNSSDTGPPLDATEYTFSSPASSAVK